MTNPSVSGGADSGETTTTGRAALWSLDEYVVVADLYLRRGRNAGVGDPEVIELARLTGRTPASISRRLGNLDGTARPGMGLKPITGEAREVFLSMRADPAARERLTREARARLSAAGIASSVTPRPPRLVDPEDFQAEIAELSVPTVTRELQRAEAQLVRRYRRWLDPGGTRLRGLIIPAGDTTLRADLFDTDMRVLIEAKAAVTRAHIRYGVGQLLDYRRHLTARPDMALFLPEALPAELVALPIEADIAVIWERKGGFVDSRDGLLTRRDVGHARS